MARDPDEDALSWGDERDATHVDASDRRLEPAEGPSNEPGPSDPPESADAREPEEATDADESSGPTEPASSTPESTGGTPDATDDLDRAFGSVAGSAERETGAISAQRDTDTDSIADPDALPGADPDARRSADPDEDSRSSLSSVALVAVGIIGGIYLLYTLGWLSAVLRDGNPYGPDETLPRTMYLLGQCLAVAAAPIWFSATLALTRSAPMRRGLPWLLVGLLVLAPWPFFLAV